MNDKKPKLKEQEKVQCPLCGYRFNKSEAKNTCAGCPLHTKSCGNVKCPNCGYDFPVPEKINLHKLWKNVFNNKVMQILLKTRKTLIRKG